MPAGKGWGGISLSDDMVGPLLLVAWPDGTTVRSSFRVARNENDSPPVVAGIFKVAAISEGTIVNDTHMMFTFVYQNCIDSKLGFAASNTLGTFEMGWALASDPVSDPTLDTTTLPFHNSGFDSFDAQLSLARNPRFGEWALLAGVTSNGSTTAVAPAPPGTSTGFAGGDNDDDDDDDDDDDKKSEGKTPTIGTATPQATTSKTPKADSEDSDNEDDD